MSRLYNLTMSQLTLTYVSRLSLFLFGSILIFCIEAWFVNHSIRHLTTQQKEKAALEQRVSTAPPKQANWMFARTLSIPTPVWFNWVKADIPADHRFLLVEITKFILLISVVLGAMLGGLFRLKIATVLVLTTFGSYLLYALLITNLPISSTPFIVAGCTYFGAATTTMALPYILWHEYLLQK